MPHTPLRSLLHHPCTPALLQAEVSQTLCCLAIPADMSVANFCTFIGAYLGEVRSMQVRRVCSSRRMHTRMHNDMHAHTAAAHVPAAADRAHGRIALGLPPHPAAAAASLPACLATTPQVLRREGSQPSVCMVLLSFATQEQADNFYTDFNTLPFSSLEPDILCRCGSSARAHSSARPQRPRLEHTA